MALIACPECDRQVSESATSCPGCGHPLRDAPSPTPSATGSIKRKGGLYEGIGFLLIVGGLLFAIAGNGTLGGFGMVVGFVVFIIGRFM